MLIIGLVDDNLWPEPHGLTSLQPQFLKETISLSTIWYVNILHRVGIQEKKYSFLIKHITIL